MNILINHCWCPDSIWGGHYDCKVIVSIYRVPEGKTYYDPPCPDWSLITEHEVNQSTPHHLYRDTLRLRPDVIQWLNDNVKDRIDAKHPKGWAIGTDEYNSASGISFRLFFERRADGMAFIKRWSCYKNPVYYLNYFKDIRRELDPKTLRLKRAKTK